MCVIADAKYPVALGGVMGGVESEVSGTTTDLLIEAAEFSPLSIRTTRTSWAAQPVVLSVRTRRGPAECRMG